MTQESKRAAIAQALISEGIVDVAEVDARIAQMAATCPEATAAEKGLTTDLDKAYEVFLIKNGGAGSASISPTATTAVATAPTESISTAEKQAINKTLYAQHADRVAVSSNSSIEQLVLDRPDPKDWIPAGTTGVIDPKVWENIEKKWADKVVPDDEQMPSKTNYEKLKAAAASGSPVEVYIGNLNTKAIGYVARLGSVSGTDNQPKQIKKDDLCNFLVLDAAGYILASDTKPGVRVRYIKPRNDPRKPGHTIPAKTVLSDANKKAAIDAGSYIISREVTAESKAVGLKSALAFKVDTGKVKQNGGGAILRTVRVTVKANIPVLARKAEFVDVFGTGEPIKNADLTMVPEGNVAKNISLAQQNAIASLRAKMAQPDSFGEVAPLAEKLSAFEVKETAGPAVAL